MNRPRPIKPFKTLKEEAEFWDTHDISPLLKNPHQSIFTLPLIEAKKRASVTIRLQESVRKKIDTIARKKGINASTLSRMWLVEKVGEYESRHMGP